MLKQIPGVFQPFHNKIRLFFLNKVYYVPHATMSYTFVLTIYYHTESGINTRDFWHN